MNASHLAERHWEARSCAGARGRPEKWNLAPPKRLVPRHPRAAHIHNLESRFDTVNKTENLETLACQETWKLALSMKKHSLVAVGEI